MESREKQRGGKKKKKKGTPRWLLIGSFPFQLHSPVASLCAHSDTWAHADMRVGPAHTVLGESPSASSSSTPPPPAVHWRLQIERGRAQPMRKEGAGAQSATERPETSKPPSQSDRIVKWNRLIRGNIIKHEGSKLRPRKRIRDYATRENSAAL